MRNLLRSTFVWLAIVLIGLFFCNSAAITAEQTNKQAYTFGTSRLSRTHQDKFSAPFWNEVKKQQKNGLITGSVDPEKLREIQLISFGKMLGFTKTLGLEFSPPLFDLDLMFKYLEQVLQNLTLIDGSRTTVSPTSFENSNDQ